MGAPYEGRGVVYLYQGGPSGLNPRPSQLVRYICMSHWYSGGAPYYYVSNAKNAKFRQSLPSTNQHESFQSIYGCNEDKWISRNFVWNFFSRSATYCQEISYIFHLGSWDCLCTIMLQINILNKTARNFVFAIWPLRPLQGWGPAGCAAANLRLFAERRAGHGHEQSHRRSRRRIRQRRSRHS